MLKDFLKDRNCKFFIIALTIIIIIGIYLIISNYLISDSETNDVDNNFVETEDDKTEVLNVYAKWCGWSKKLLPEWTKVENYYKNNNNIVIRKVEENEDNELIQKLQIAGFPSIFKIRNGEIQEFPHNEKRTADNIIKWIG